MSNEDRSSAISQPDRSGAEDARRFGLMVCARRKAQELRQEDVASATGVGRRHIMDVENGKPTLKIGPALMIVRFPGIVPMVEHALSALQDSDFPDMIPEDTSDRIPEDLADDLPSWRTEMKIFYESREVAEIAPGKDGAATLTYNTDWQGTQGAFPVSIRMPLDAYGISFLFLRSCFDLPRTLCAKDRQARRHQYPARQGSAYAGNCLLVQIRSLQAPARNFCGDPQVPVPSLHHPAIAALEECVVR